MKNISPVDENLHKNSELSLKYEVWSLSAKPVNGEVQLIRMEALPDAKDTSASVYTTIRTYRRSTGQAFYLYLDKHIHRLQESLRIEGEEVAIDDGLLKQLLACVEKRSLFIGDLRIKILIAPEKSMSYYYQVEPLTIPSPEMYKYGATVLTRHYQRVHPLAKSYGFVQVQEKFRAEANNQVEEILMVNDDREITEGLSSNFFAIKQDTLFTAGSGVLEGVTRQIVLVVAAKMNLKTLFQPIKVDDLTRISECFITSTSRGVLPVSNIDQNVIGPGIPGPITRKLMDLFDQEIEGLIKPL